VRERERGERAVLRNHKTHVQAENVNGMLIEFAAVIHLGYPIQWFRFIYTVQFLRKHVLNESG